VSYEISYYNKTSERSTAKNPFLSVTRQSFLPAGICYHLKEISTERFGVFIIFGKDLLPQAAK
jgi:hypothetical protein